MLHRCLLYDCIKRTQSRRRERFNPIISAHLTLHLSDFHSQLTVMSH